MWGGLTADENLRLVGRLYGLAGDTTAAALERVGLAAHAGTRRATSRRASASDSAWRAPWSPSRTCCCSTSRTRASTGAARELLDALLEAAARLGDDRSLATHDHERGRRLCSTALTLTDGGSRDDASLPARCARHSLLARKDLLLEARSPELVAGVGLFSLAALVGLHFAVAGDGRQVSAGLAGGVLWVVLILAATLAAEPRVLGRARCGHHSTRCC